MLEVGLGELGQEKYTLGRSAKSACWSRSSRHPRPVWGERRRRTRGMTRCGASMKMRNGCKTKIASMQSNTRLG